VIPVRRLSACRVERLKGLGAAGVAAGLTGWPSVSRAHGAPGWGAFDAAVGKEFARMGLVPAAVTVVSADRVLHARTLGVRAARLGSGDE